MGAAVTAFGVSSPPNGSNAPRFQVVVDRLVVPTAPEASVDFVQRSIRIQEADSLAKALERSGAADDELLEFVQADSRLKGLRELSPGATLHAEIDSIGRVHELRYALGLTEDSYLTGTSQRIRVHRSAEGIEATIDDVPLVRSMQVLQVTIESSLFAATAQAGIPDRVASQIADTFGGDINFERDLRKGDRLRVIYETLHEPDSLAAPVPGRLLAAELSNRGRQLNAIWLEDAPGRGQYYDFDGRSVSKSFLRYPIEFARISSGFTMARMHPILGRRQAHRGVDFAAAPGTAIRATADGEVEFLGNQRGYGNVIELRHHNDYTTLYAHMRGFKSGLRQGHRVRQGDVIGYVGSTGWATGPHLHYELRVNGQHRNPLKANLPEAKPLDAGMRELHAQRVSTLRSQFALLDEQPALKVAGRFE